MSSNLKTDQLIGPPNPMWLAYRIDQPTVRATGKSEEEAIDALLLIGMPSGFVWEHNRFLASDEFPWNVKHPDYDGLYGHGSSPSEAMTDWQSSRERDWYRGKLARLFKNMRMMADCWVHMAPNNQEAVTHQKDVRNFVKDWENDLIGIKRPT